MAFLDIFVGVPQSKYTATAILAAIVVVSLAILFGKENIPLGQKFAFVLIVFLVSLPSIVLTLFQLTCLVTGASKNRWCGWYAWLVSILLIIYSILIIVIAVVAFSSGKSVNKALELGNMEGFQDELNQADTFANEYFTEKVDATPASAQAPAPTPAPAVHEPQVPPPSKFTNPEDFEEEQKEAFTEDYENEEMFENVSGGMSIPAPAGMSKFANVASLF